MPAEPAAGDEANILSSTLSLIPFLKFKAENERPQSALASRVCFSGAINATKLRPRSAKPPSLAGTFDTRRAAKSPTRRPPTATGVRGLQALSKQREDEVVTNAAKGLFKSWPKPKTQRMEAREVLDSNQKSNLATTSSRRAKRSAGVASGNTVYQ